MPDSDSEFTLGSVQATWNASATVPRTSRSIPASQKAFKSSDLSKGRDELEKSEWVRFQERELAGLYGKGEDLSLVETPPCAQGYYLRHCTN